MRLFSFGGTREGALLVDLSAKCALLLCLVGSLMFVALAVAPENVERALLGEDGVVEILSALAYPVGIFFALRIARVSRGWSRGHWLMWAVLCFLFFGEETSWLQHLIGYKTPDAVKAINAQSEFNIHNLNVFTADRGLVQAENVSLSPRVWRDSQILFYLGFTTYFLLLPLSRIVPAADRALQRVGAPHFSARFLFAVWVPIAVSAVLTWTSRDDLLRKKIIGETREMVFAITIMLFIALAYKFMRRRMNEVGGAAVNPCVGSSTSDKPRC